MVSTRPPNIVITAGEPAGIGPDLCLLLTQTDFPAKLTVVADREMLARRAQEMGVSVDLIDFTGTPVTSGQLSVLHVPAAETVVPGKLDTRNSPYVLRTLEIAANACLDRKFDAMVTAPVHKGVISDAGFSFTGHTEYLAERTKTDHVVMMLVGGGLRVALATTHLPLKDVPAAISPSGLETTIRILNRDLIDRFGIANPSILVTGLNPHAGESGHLGREEIEVIIPVLEKLRREKFDLRGPLAADTLFTPEHLKGSDCVLAMYHDQGLPVLKHASFGAGVNVTLGLPIIRTSVDHGTALGLAGKGTADCGSLIAAIELAIELARGAPRTA